MPDAPAKAGRRAPPARHRVIAADRLVAARLRERRVALGLSQHELAALLGVTPQQAYKYEKGLNRLTVGRLHRLAEAMGVGVAYFYEGLGRAGDAPGLPPDQRRLRELARHFAALPEPQQEVLCELARALAGPAAGRSP